MIPVRVGVHPSPQFRTTSNLGSFVRRQSYNDLAGTTVRMVGNISGKFRCGSNFATFVWGQRYWLFLGYASTKRISYFALEWLNFQWAIWLNFRLPYTSGKHGRKHIISNFETLRILIPSSENSSIGSYGWYEADFTNFDAHRFSWKDLVAPIIVACNPIPGYTFKPRKPLK